MFNPLGSNSGQTPSYSIQFNSKKSEVSFTASSEGITAKVSAVAKRGFSGYISYLFSSNWTKYSYTTDNQKKVILYMKRETLKDSLEKSIDIEKGMKDISTVVKTALNSALNIELTKTPSQSENKSIEQKSEEIAIPSKQQITLKEQILTLGMLKDSLLGIPKTKDKEQLELAAKNPNSEISQKAKIQLMKINSREKRAERFKEKNLENKTETQQFLKEIFGKDISFKDAVKEHYKDPGIQKKVDKKLSSLVNQLNIVQSPHLTQSPNLNEIRHLNKGEINLSSPDAKKPTAPKTELRSILKKTGSNKNANSPKKQVSFNNDVDVYTYKKDPKNKMNSPTD